MHTPLCTMHLVNPNPNQVGQLQLGTAVFLSSGPLLGGLGLYEARVTGHEGGCLDRGR